MEKQVLDYMLVPVGLLFMVAYHLWLLHRILKHPLHTVIGINSINRQFWVRAMMEDPSKNGVLAVQTLRNNIMASTLLASTAIMLSSLFAVLVNGRSKGSYIGFHIYGDKSELCMSIKFFSILDPSKNGVLAVQTLRNNIMASTLLASTAIMLSSLIAVLMTGGSKEGRSVGFHIYGNKSEFCLSIKFFSILVCFMVAFLFNVQSIRYYSHASILINVPYKKSDSSKHCVTAAYVGKTVNRGSYFWSLGLRAFYFSFPLFLWIFGPIPMFLCCLFLVFMLYFLDGSSDLGWVTPTEDVETQQTA